MFFPRTAPDRNVVKRLSVEMKNHTSKRVLEMALLGRKEGLDITVCFSNLEKAHPCAEARRLMHGILRIKTLREPWL